MKIDEITRQMRVLNIEHYPFLFSELTESFRVQIKKYHPDIYKGKDGHEKTMEIVESYKILKSYASDTDFKKIEIEEKLFDFTKECDRCNGKGYHISFIKKYTYQCAKCKDTGFIKIKCRHCDNGKFTLKSGRIVECKTCMGTGIYSLKCNHFISAYDNLSERYHNPYTEIQQKHKCEKCNGSGKLVYEPLNPVIRKGAILK